MYIRVGFVSSSVVVNRRYRVLVFQRVSPDIDFSAQCYYDQNSSLLRRKENAHIHPCKILIGCSSYLTR